MFLCPAHIVYTTGSTLFGLRLDSLYSEELDGGALKRWVHELSSAIDIDQDEDDPEFKEIFLDELFFFCIYIASSDGEISENEATAIAWLIDDDEYDCDRDNIEEIACDLYEDEWMEEYPLSFEILVNVFGQGAGSRGLETAGVIAQFYRQIARFIYSQDNYSEIDEIEDLGEYVSSYKKYVERVAVIDFAFPENEEMIADVCAAWNELAEKEEKDRLRNLIGVWQPVSGNAFTKVGLSTLALKENGEGEMVCKKLFRKKKIPLTWELADLFGDGRSTAVVNVPKMRLSVCLIAPSDSDRIVAIVKSVDAKLNNAMGEYHRISS